MDLKQYNRVVVKVGSALLVQDNRLRQGWLEYLCDDIASVIKSGTEVVLVSSGAVALGCHRLGLPRRGLTFSQKHACAAVGQSALTRAYENALHRHGYMSAQALLTLQDTEVRRRWLNARATLTGLLEYKVVPIVNENDTVATDGIKFGDNDRLAARTAQMIGADLLVLLSDIDGLYTADPRSNPEAEHLPVIEDLSDEIMAMGGGVNKDSGVGSGGMATKLIAAQIATGAGCDMVICNGNAPSPLARLQSGDRHTWFKSVIDPKNARDQWIVGSLAPSGALVIDDGAAGALKNGNSLLAAGMTRIDGTFAKGDTISIINHDGKEIARGLSTYDSHKLGPICGLRSEDIPYPEGPVVVHRDNLVML